MLHSWIFAWTPQNSTLHLQVFSCFDYLSFWSILRLGINDSRAEQKDLRDKDAVVFI